MAELGRPRDVQATARRQSSISLRTLRLSIVILAIALGSAHEAAAQTLTLSLFERYLESLRVQAGIPGMSVPAGLDAKGLPLGLQVLGKSFDEETVFAVGRAIEQAACFTATPALKAAA